jgi:hypothetical protein
MKIFLSILSVLLFEFSFAQDYPGLSLLYSRTPLAGTARSIGSGGAYGSVGADLGSIGINPAGLALYRTADFSLSGGLQLANNEAVYDGSTTNAKVVKPYLGQIGIEWTKVLKKPSQEKEMGFSGHLLHSFTFAFNYQQQALFGRTQNYNYNNTQSSLIDNYTNYLNNGGSVYDFPEIYVANYANLVGYNAVTNKYYSNITAPVFQQGSTTTAGSSNKIDIAFGGNILDKLYFGIDIGVPFLNYSISQSFGETPGNQAGIYQGYNLWSTYTNRGVGINGSLGLIYRPAAWVRVGAAFHLPTWYSINENYSFGVNVDTGGYVYQYSSPQAPDTKYGLRTPMQGDAGISFYYKQYGFLSVDYSFQNYGSSRIHFPGDSTNLGAQVNSAIKSTYKYGHNIRAGVEATIKVLRLRLGYSYNTSPFKKGQEVSAGYNQSVNQATAGIGVRLKNFYADFAYAYGFTKDASIPYYSDAVNSTLVTHNFILTLGWKFSEAGNNTKPKKKKTYNPPPVDIDTPRY